MNSLDRKNLTNIMIFTLLMIGIVAAIYLSQRTQIFKSRAAADPIMFSGENLETRNNKQVVKPTINSDGNPVWKVDIELNAITTPPPTTQ